MRSNAPMVGQLVAAHDQRAAAAKPTPSGMVINLGFTASAEATTASLTTPLHGAPGGVAVASGLYLDTGRWELGEYQRIEMRWGLGAYAGAGVEGGVTLGRDNFEGDGASAFAEGGSLGRVGVEANSTSVGVSAGAGEGAATGVAVTHTETEPLLRAEDLLMLNWGPNTRRWGL